MALRLHPRSLGVAAILVTACLVLLVFAVGTGEYPINAGDVVRTLLGGGDTATTFVVEQLRLPRALTALLVGAALGVAGAIFQSVTRNPLGSPDIIGFTAGASAAGVLQILLLGGGTMATAAAAMAGGLATAAFVGGLAVRDHGLQGYRLVLVGLGVSALLAALTDFLVSRAGLDAAQQANVWLTGSLNGRGWEHVEPLALALAVLLPCAGLLSRPLAVMELGDEIARGVGVDVGRSRVALIVVGAMLTGVAVATAGPIAFVALAAPQIARRLTRAPGPGIACAALMGAALLLTSDLLTQRAFGAGELPVGVTTGVIGGMYLVWLLAREWRAGTA